MYDGPVGTRIPPAARHTILRNSVIRVHDEAIIGESETTVVR